MHSVILRGCGLELSLTAGALFAGPFAHVRLSVSIVYTGRTWTPGGPDGPLINHLLSSSPLSQRPASVAVGSRQGDAWLTRFSPTDIVNSCVGITTAGAGSRTDGSAYGLGSWSFWCRAPWFRRNSLPALSYRTPRLMN